MDQEKKSAIRGSKQADAKSAQGYDPKPISRTCANCAHRKSEMALPDWMARENAGSQANGRQPKYGKAHEVEKSLRCGIGGFAIKQMATCNEFQMAGSV